ncbi:MAG: WD40/YVTN/BNR-like repeat-containing protein [Fimbriimonas sp.]
MILGILIGTISLTQAASATAVAVAPDGMLLVATSGAKAYRSSDGGAKWAEVKLPGRGVAIAFDPNNPLRSLLATPTALFLSSDAAKTWRIVLPFDGGDFRMDSLAFDPTTYDKKKNRSMVVHWSGPHGLFRSLDGGKSWTATSDSRAQANASLRHHPMLRDTLFAATATNVVQSTDAGHSFREIRPKPVAGFDVADAAVDTIWTAGDDGLWRSRDAGRTWLPLPPKRGLRPGEALSNVRVCPDDPDRIAIQRKSDGRWLISHDGGNAWRPVPRSDRNSQTAWSPLDRDIVWITVPNGVQKSLDGGFTWHFVRLP